jgi:hypothetical protein
VSARLHRVNLYDVLRKLIPKLQALSKGIEETSMVRFYSSINAYDKMPVVQIGCDNGFHGIPHQKPLPHIEESPNARQRSRRFKCKPILVGIVLPFGAMP